MTKRAFVTVSMILLGVLASARSQAQPLWAQAVGGGCVPDSATINAKNYETAGFGVRFSPTGTGDRKSVV